VITHAGHGSVLKALAAGVPLVCMPLGRDQKTTPFGYYASEPGYASASENAPKASPPRSAECSTSPPTPRPPADSPHTSRPRQPNTPTPRKKPKHC